MRDTSIGCDLELIEPRSAVFISDYLTAEEQELIRDAPDDQKSVLVNLIWSAKESVLKAKRVGLRSSTLSLTVVALEGAFNSRRQHGTTWSALAVQDELDTLYRGWWQSEHLLVRTIVTRPSSTEPIYLK
jgi:4'-phosphopantetheinyl transferase